jgi:hypothetical protein
LRICSRVYDCLLCTVPIHTKTDSYSIDRGWPRSIRRDSWCLGSRTFDSTLYWLASVLLPELCLPDAISGLHLSIGYCKLHPHCQAKAHSYHLFNIFTSACFGGNHLTQWSLGSEFATLCTRGFSYLFASPKAPGQSPVSFLQMYSSVLLYMVLVRCHCRGPLCRDPCSSSN